MLSTSKLPWTSTRGSQTALVHTWPCCVITPSEHLGWQQSSSPSKGTLHRQQQRTLLGTWRLRIQSTGLPSSNTFLQRQISGKTWLSSPQSNLLCSSGMVKEGLRPSSGSWLQGSCWHLTMCWMQRESMHVGSGSATSKGHSSSCLSMLAYGLLTTAKTARHVIIVQISSLTCWLRHKRTERACRLWKIMNQRSPLGREHCSTGTAWASQQTTTTS